MWRVTAIELYVLRRNLTTVGAAFLLLSAVVLLINFVALSRDVGQRADVPFLDLLGLAALQTPSVMTILLPFVFLFGCMFAFVALNRRSELVAMRAAGVSAWRFIFPAGAAAALVGVAVFALADPVITELNRAFETTRERVAERAERTADRQDAREATPAAPDRLWVRQGAPGRQTVIGARPLPGATLRLSEVTVLFYAVPRAGTPTFLNRIDAPRAELRGQDWIFFEARDSRPGQATPPPATLRLRSTEESRAAFARLGEPERVSFWGLADAISRAEQAGLSSTALRLRLHQLLATPLMLAGMAVLAAAFSLRLLRLGQLARLAGTGVVLGFAFFFVNDLCAALGRAGYIAPWIAGWTPPALAMLSGFTWLCYTEDG